jgi:hypothetical protein
MGVRKGPSSSLSAAILAGVASSLIACAAPENRTAGSAADVAASPAPARPASRLRQEPPPADLGAVERYAWQTVIQLADAYASGDVDGFLGRVSRGFYRGYPALESGLRALVGNTTSRSAVVAVREVALDGDRVSVRTQWERTLVRRDGVPETKEGQTTFYFLKSDTSLRLLDFRGDVPFGIEGVPALP